MTINKFKDELLHNLVENILLYWVDNMVDPHGGFYGRRDGHGCLDPDAPKGAILNARILWTFSAAYRVLGNPVYLDMATRAKREVIDRFHDKDYGGVYWSLDASGLPLDTRKQFYAIGFAIYGLSEYARATGDKEALDMAVGLFHDIEARSRDRQAGGYIEALTRDWQPIGDMRLSAKDDNAVKTMNTHLHILEPYTNLLRVWPDEELKEATRALLRIFIDRIVDSGQRYHLGLFFNNDWTRTDGIVSYGHDIEASWLMLEAARELGDAQLLDETLEVTEKIATAASEGRCHDGSMVYERHAGGVYDNDKHWWVQAENVIGQIYMYLFHGRKDMLDKAMQSWAYIRDNMVDNEKGEWYWSLRGNEINLNEDKAGFWKCPYHNSRMCLEILELL